MAKIFFSKIQMINNSNKKFIGDSQIQHQGKNELKSLSVSLQCTPYMGKCWLIHWEQGEQGQLQTNSYHGQRLVDVTLEGNGPAVGQVKH